MGENYYFMLPDIILKVSLCVCLFHSVAALFCLQETLHYYLGKDVQDRQDEHPGREEFWRGGQGQTSHLLLQPSHSSGRTQRSRKNCKKKKNANIS